MPRVFSLPGNLEQAHQKARGGTPLSTCNNAQKRPSMMDGRFV
jgi:hypothetical protein